MVLYVFCLFPGLETKLFVLLHGLEAECLRLADGMA